MTTIDSISYVIQGLLIGGTALRVIICLLKIAANPDSKEQIVPRIKNSLAFMVLGIAVFSLKNIIVGYYQ